MRGSRNIVRLSIVAICVLIFAAAGWCGGPPAGPSAAPSAAGAAAADQGSVGQSYSGSQASAATGGAEQGGLNMAGGYGGSSGLDGANGRSPGYDLKSIGIANGYTDSGRLKYDPFALGDMSFRIIWDYGYTLAQGSTIYSGPPGPFVPGVSSLSSQYSLTVNAVSLDIDTAAVAGVGSWIAGGPRLQYANFSDLLMVDDATIPANSVSAGKGFSMFGIGLWGSINLAQLTGLSYGGDMAVVQPTLCAAVTMGKGGGMNYWEWEAFVQVVKTASSLYTTDSVGIGALALEIGYSRYNFTETIQEITVAGTADGNVRMTVGIPMIRASLPIMF